MRRSARSRSRRTLGRVAVASTAVALASLASGIAAPPASAVPNPADGEWWFDAWGITDIWERTQGAGMTVAVVDTGVQASVPELSGGVVLPGTDLVGSTDGRSDSDGHGTNMAALIAGQGGGAGMVGIAPQTKILPITIHNEAGQATYAEGIRWAVDHGANIINISQAQPGTCIPADESAVRYAIDHNVVVVAGAGNSGNADNVSNSPANCRGVLSVGAVNDELKPWDNTQRHDYVDVAAPGVDDAAIDENDTFGISSGTSDATALTSGAIALVWSAHPDESNREIVARMMSVLRTAPGQDATPGQKDPELGPAIGYGVLVPADVLDIDVPDDAPNPVFEELDAAQPTAPAGDAPPAGDTDNAASDDGGSSTALIVGLAAVGVAIVLIVILIAVIWKGRRRTPPVTFGAPGAGPPPGPYQNGPYQSGQPYQDQYGPPPEQAQYRPGGFPGYPEGPE